MLFCFTIVFYLAQYVLMFNMVLGFPYNSVPTREECHSMVPSSIRSDPQATNERPFKILVSDNIYHQTSVKVSIERSQNVSYPIKGFMLQARRAKCDHKYQSRPVGQFEVAGSTNNMLVVGCSGSPRNTVINRSFQSMIVDVTWNSNNQDFERVYFIATVFSSEKVYWKDVTSEIIRHLSDKVDDGEICPALPLSDTTSIHMLSGSFMILVLFLNSLLIF